MDIIFNKYGLTYEKIPLFIVKRGPNWSKCYKICKQFLKDRIKQVKPLLDDLYS